MLDFLSNFSGVFVVFFTTLTTLIIFLGFKVYELNHGVKPFSAYRYKADSFLSKKFEILVRYIRYINPHTAKLLGLFIVSEAKSIILIMARKLEQSNVGEMVQGRNVTDGERKEPHSVLLKGMSSLKKEKKTSSK